MRSGYIISEPESGYECRRLTPHNNPISLEIEKKDFNHPYELFSFDGN
jgi:hypothetical protein